MTPALPPAVPAPAYSDLCGALVDLDPGAGPAAWLLELVRRRFDRLPLPGSGSTMQRWQALAAVAERDLSLAKLFEGHTDALAILRELDDESSASSDTAAQARDTWGVWAAEAPGGRTVVHLRADGSAVLRGGKCWCSGARELSHGLLTAWHADGRGPQLVSVAMRQPGVSVSGGAWHAVGMAGSASIDVTFDDASVCLVGGVGDYLKRPGFWQGGAGVAACWYGGALGIGHALRRAVAETPSAERTAFRLAALGKVDLSLRTTAALLRDAAHWIDDHPTHDASEVALRVRLAAEACARTVLDEVGRSLGAAAFCRDARFARAAADLPVFIRQSHAERDFAALGERLASSEACPWKL
jgi:hypothetical protein